ncbi:hypothetical protein BJ165DRAFT_1553600 [Panaeolus papilionaceus]|nr:hypothetical protein BJ165DRAFT_1553600 [Panaeolus papilionaceus]
MDQMKMRVKLPIPAQADDVSPTRIVANPRHRKTRSVSNTEQNILEPPPNVESDVIIQLKERNETDATEEISDGQRRKEKKCFGEGARLRIEDKVDCKIKRSGPVP